MAPPGRRRRRGLTRPDLPTDVIFEILSRTPVKPLCRFRCLSREWRATIASPVFLAAQNSRSGSLPLLAALYSGRDQDPPMAIESGLRLMDVEGIVREIKMDLRAYGRPFLLNLFDDRIYLVEQQYIYTHLIDVATGEVLLDVHKLIENQRYGIYSIGAGHAALSGALKVVRLTRYCDADGRLDHACEVLEFDPGGGDGCRWRDSDAPPADPCYYSSVATVDGVLHFLTDVGNKVLHFDLKTEQWRKTVGGPQIEDGSGETETRIGIGKLNGALCMVAERRRAAEQEQPCVVDVWRLSNPENSTWVKAPTIPMDRALMPLIVTPDGGKILFSGLPFNGIPLPPPALLPYDLRDKITWNVAVRKMSTDKMLVGFGLCRLPLEHFVV